MFEKKCMFFFQKMFSENVRIQFVTHPILGLDYLRQAKGYNVDFDNGDNGSNNDFQVEKSEMKIKN